MRKLLAFLISIYQTKISPHKGFRCAHKGLHKGESCSEYTKQKILKKGVLPSFKHIRQRFRECGEAAQVIQRGGLKHQRGDCDLGLSGCDSCDIGDLCGGKNTFPLDCLNCGDIFHSDKKNRKRDLCIFLLFVLALTLLIYFFL